MTTDPPATAARKCCATVGGEPHTSECEAIWRATRDFPTDPHGDSSLDLKMMSGWPVAGVTLDPSGATMTEPDTAARCSSCGARRWSWKHGPWCVLEVLTRGSAAPDLDELCPLCADWIVDGECGCPV
jgi:hypothetical protein